MSGFGQQHTAYNIGQKLEDVVETWLVPLGVKVGIVTSDNAQNVVKALNDRGMKRAPCMAHCLNLVVKASLTKSGAELEETLKAARAIVGHFRHSASAQRQLEAIQLRHGLPVHKLLQDVLTRWNSTFYMAERLSEQRRAVSEFFEDSTKHYLAPRQWALLKAMATVLKPFEEATRLLCMDTSTLGQVLPLLTFIERTVTHTMTDITTGDEDGGNKAQTKICMHIFGIFVRDSLLIGTETVAPVGVFGVSTLSKHLCDDGIAQLRDIDVSSGSAIYPDAVSSSLINPEAPSCVALEGDPEAASPAEAVLVAFCL
ncbi:hypothetical protein HPB47_027188 [Ixodes persulcatus]|uniref:Uncharacterized protein n=1 Tax=Ixodes persulcatus TaxID=34615 RepID=A0AC60PY17_IXOPE|nr:hypothetical protein HPB47_027188 [Ixodes persulcatus]